MRAIVLAVGAAGAAGSVGAADASPPGSASKPLRMWQTTPGVNFNDSFLIGNGRLGFSLPGGALSESIVLNEDSFWSGGEMDRVNPDAAAHMPEIQALIARGEIREASRLASMSYVGTPVSVRHFDWVGKLGISMRGSAGQVRDYERWLDVGEGVAGVYYTVGGVAYKREYTASFPDDVIAVQISANKSGAVSFDLHQSRGIGLNLFQDSAGGSGKDTILMGGGSFGAKAIVFAAGAKVTIDGGSMKRIGDTIVVDGADSATIYWSAWTTYRKSAGELQSAVMADLSQASRKGYGALRSDHVKDYQSLAGRVELSLGKSTSEQKAKTTADRLRGLRTAFDPEIATLYFYFARYLLIASGRPGTLPANLQGLWNNDLNPMWGSKYTININLEMNYWPSLLTNMPELHESMFEHIMKMHEKGRDVAKRMYNASGSVCHHNTDIWGDCAPQDNYAASTFWPSGLAWMATHIYEHYQFTGDVDVLRKYYPALRDAAVFFLDFMTEHDGHLVTNPSVSPEISYRLPNTTQSVALTLGPTADNSIIWELVGMVLESQKILGDSDPDNIGQRLTGLRARLPPLRKDQYGGIAEFHADFTEDEPGHRHFSQLFGLFPGSQITASNGTTFAAARASLRRRLAFGGGDTGWSRAWAVALEARLLNATGVAASYAHLLTRLTYPNSMLDVNEPSAFQLDGNYGGVTIVEALVQSHELVAAAAASGSMTPAYVGESGGGKAAHHLIRLLPALPRQWAVNGGGFAKGLLVRGGFELDVHWDGDARLLNATITSHKGNTAWVVLGGAPLGDESPVPGPSQAIKMKGIGQGSFLKLQSETGGKYVVIRA
ncbi:hypothetical protein GGTG_02212 [Gaeumannomyces tritici R3-111a-1]|uniref:Uncharacterized protein n=1 Tax=Gaeumannomyces tritici (strain R3-111a-1) TaxID=644352 RepID=J3NLR2_GAET3|nr:hypothetical protein GGTG_02212 [Gaeumannomyces tritici R3-111a-1]EJT82238.1 hypothetical protein GGTG_02212 [Gaeumannomyces tritici R3-111a-1]